MKNFKNYPSKKNNSTPDYKTMCSIDNTNIFFNTPCNIERFDLSNKLWKQVSLSGNITASKNNPLIKEIDSINAEVEIVNKKVLKSPSIMKNRDFEGLRGGERIIKIYGLLCFSVNYVALLKKEEIYAFQDKIPFSVTIDLPLKDSAQKDMIDFEYILSSCIEDIHINSIIDRNINLSITLIILASKSFEKDNICIDDNYFKDIDTNCKNIDSCLNCNDENQIIFKGIFSQDKLEDISKDAEIKSLKRFNSSEILNLPKCNPNIIKILSVNTNIKILCQRITKTPITNKNLENKELTGFALLINFLISHNIKYSSTTSCESIHFATFDFPSSLYITPRDTTLLNDKFKIFHYIDDIYACILDERQIFISTSMLFEAKLINCKINPNNIITFRGKDDKKIATLEFYLEEKKLRVVSTGDISNTDFSSKEYFSLEVNKENIKYKSIVHGNENADFFRNDLNNKDIEEDNTIILNCRERERVCISNYEGQKEYYPKYFSEIFKLTPMGLESDNPNILTNVISFKGKNDKDISIIRFNKDSLTLIVASSGLQANLNFLDEVYFSFEVKNSSNVLKFKGQVMGNEDADNFKKELNNQSFDYGDILILTYKENNRVNITNYNNKENYTPNGNSEAYIISNDGIKPVELSQNNITVKGQSEEKIASISFNKSTSSLIVESFGIVSNPIFGDKYYFSFELTDENGTEKYKSIIKGNENANNFKSILNNRNFNNGDIINLTYREADRVFISNYDGLDEYNPKYFSESYKITTNGLAPNNPNILTNVITFKGANNRAISVVRFNKDNLSLIVDSSGLQANLGFSTEVYFSFEIKENLTTSKIKSEIRGNDDADDFKNILNNYSFSYGDILTLNYKENNNVNITNYNGNLNYNPSGTYETYEITQEGIKGIQLITIKGQMNKEIATINFDKHTSSLVIESFGTIANPIFKDKYYFSFQLIDESGIEKHKSIIKGIENADNFKIALNGINFNNDDIINLAYRERDQVYISNYQNSSQYNPKYFSESYKIIGNELTPNAVDILPNVITFKGKNDNEIAIIRFNKNNPSLIIDSSGLQANLDFLAEVYFSLEIKDDFNVSKIKTEVKGNDDADSFKNALNGYEFIYGDILTLTYKENNRVNITNYNQSPNYTPTGNVESYEITPEGIKELKTVSNNSITIYGLFNLKFATINFDSNNKLIVTSMGNQLVSNYEDVVALKFLFKDKNLNNKVGIFTRGNEDATNFANALNDIDFEIGDIFRFNGISNISLSIGNYKGQNSYWANWDSSDFNLQVTPNGLRLANFKFLKNTIILYRKSGNIKTVFYIKFETNSLKLFANSSGGRINNINFSRREYFKLVLKSAAGTTKINLTQLGTPNTITFTNAIDEKSFSYGDTLKLICREPNMMVITNYNNKAEYNQPFYSERYSITTNGLEPFSNIMLENIITFKGETYDHYSESIVIKVIAIIRFDITKKVLIVDSSGFKLSENSNFSLTLTTSKREVKISVGTNDDADRLRNILDEKAFELGDTVTLTYVDNTKVEITKFNGKDIYNPTGTETSYEITSSGLILKP